MTGLLRIKGSIDLAQFWPEGESDADTTKIKVAVHPGGIEFAADGRHLARTTALDDAIVIGTGRRPLIKDGKITVRLQGIDAPELHYQAGALPRGGGEVTAAKREAYNLANKPKRRQFWAETATIALQDKLNNFGSGTIDCAVYSHVDHPVEVADTYGRMVGTIVVGADTDVNAWLVEEGWAFPTYYSSMSRDEIETLNAAAKLGRKKRRIWSGLTGDSGIFDASLLYRPHGEPEPATDKGKVLMPKLFRRQVAFRALKKARIITGGFKTYLATKQDDAVFDATEFLEQGIHTAPTYLLADYFEGRMFTADPQDVIFREKFSTLVDASGKKIERF